MTAYPIEIILTRQWADSLLVPVFLTDIKGNLIFYNLEAEKILGKRFEETGSMPVEEWSQIFTPRNADGSPLPPHELPLVQTLQKRKPANRIFWIDSLDGERHEINVSSFPIVGLSGIFHGAVAIFWTNTES